MNLIRQKKSLALALIGWLLGACGAVATQPDVPEPVAEPVDTTPRPLPTSLFFIPGETMNFDFHFRDILVGRGALAVGHPGVLDGRPTLLVRSEIGTTGIGKMVKVIRDDVITWLDTERARPMQQTAEMVFGESMIDFKIRCAGRWVFVEIHRKGARYQQGMRKRFARTRRHHRLPEGEIGHDAHSVLGALRAWEGRVGERIYFYAISGARMWRADLVFDGHDSRTTPIGNYPALRFVGTAQRLTRKMQPDPRFKKPRTFTIWLSDDANRLPLAIEGKTELGTAAVRLVDYYKPR